MHFFVCEIFLSSVKKNEFPLISTNKADFLTKKVPKLFAKTRQKFCNFIIFFSRKHQNVDV